SSTNKSSNAFCNVIFFGPIYKDPLLKIPHSVISVRPAWAKPFSQTFRTWSKQLPKPIADFLTESIFRWQAQGLSYLFP
ncbi:Serpentine receptor class epsilon-21, partial [Orchesella cincta]